MDLGFVFAKLKETFLIKSLSNTKKLVSIKIEIETQYKFQFFENV